MINSINMISHFSKFVSWDERFLFSLQLPDWLKGTSNLLSKKVLGLFLRGKVAVT
jgi:hypothetical protein